MKRINNLFEQIVSFNNLLEASRKARIGKRYKLSASQFEFNLEKEIILLRQELIENKYKPGSYKEFFIYEPKMRMISAAPYRDRVVHHAICNIIEPIFESLFIFDSYANRKQKGTHKAILRFQSFMKKKKHVLKCDIKKYFPSIDHIILKELIRKKIKCLKTLKLIDMIIDNSNHQEEIIEYFEGDDLFTPFERKRGLPIGNLTSQFFANIYLNQLDHFIKEELKCKYYVRYVDDFIICGDSKEVLNNFKSKIELKLQSLRLKINFNKSMIHHSKNGIEFLGHKIFPEFRLLKRANVIRFKKKVKLLAYKYEQKTIAIDKIKQSIQAWMAHASFSNTFRLRKKLIQQYVFE